MEIERSENLLDVLKKYYILGFRRLGSNRLKFYRTETLDTLDTLTGNQISLKLCFIEYPEFVQICDMLENQPLI